MVTLPDIERRFECGCQLCLSYSKQGSDWWIPEAQTVESMHIIKVGDGISLNIRSQEHKLPKFTSLAAILRVKI